MLKLVALLLASAAPPPALVGAAVQAAEAGEYCDASQLFEATYVISARPQAAFNAAEVALAHGDRARAVKLYRAAQGHAEFTKRALLRARLSEATRALKMRGPGTPCPARVAQCGDWWVDEDERCDDGNTINGDGCDANCQPSGCGNGIVSGREDCDDGNAIDGDGCDSTCTPSSCGNGVVAGDEHCDDGNFTDGDGCDHDCSPTACGNGVLSRGEQCDDGNQVSGDGCDAGCVFTRCGNGVVTAGEQCDDGNFIDDDGCDAACTFTEIPAPMPGIAVTTAGGAAVLAGGALLGYGTYSYVVHEDSVAVLRARQQQFALDPNGAVEDVQAERDARQRAFDEYTTLGVTALSVGTALFVLGGAAVGGGIWLALTHTEPMIEEAP